MCATRHLSDVHAFAQRLGKATLDGNRSLSKISTFATLLSSMVPSCIRTRSALTLRTNTLSIYVNSLGKKEFRSPVTVALSRTPQTGKGKRSRSQSRSGNLNEHLLSSRVMPCFDPTNAELGVNKEAATSHKCLGR